MKLSVYLFDTLTGYLFTTTNRGIVFVYDEQYIKNGGFPLSLSLPLQQEEFSQKQCLPYFSGLLPEGSTRNRISEYLHISESSTMKFLQALEGNVAELCLFMTRSQTSSFPKSSGV